MSKNDSIKISELLRIIANRIQDDPKFLTDLESFLKNKKEKRSEKNLPQESILNIWEIHESIGEEELLRILNELPVSQLVKIIQKNGLDQSKLSYKWKTKDKLINLIKTRISDRINKGRNFLEFGNE